MSSIEYLNALGRLVHVFGGPTATDDARLEAIRALASHAERGVLVVRVGPPGEAAAPSPDTPDATAFLLGILRRHAVRRLVIRRGAGARELAQFAGLLVRDDPSDVPSGAEERSGGAPADASTRAAGALDHPLARALDALRIWSVHVEFHGAAAAEGVALPAPVEEALGAVAAAEHALATERAYSRLSGVLASVAEGGTPAAGAQVAQALARVVDLQGVGEEDRSAYQAAAHAAGLEALLKARLGAAVDAVLAETAPDAWRVLQHAADRAVPLLLHRLGAAESLEERRRCFDAILETGGGIDALLDALRDPRWFVVRNVALLLGELRDAAAVRPLARALQGADVRVREAAAQALDRIDTPAAVHALVGALRDSSPAVRRIAAGALPRAAGHLVPVAVAFMTDRLRIESDAEVAHALVDALQTMATPEAFGALAVLAVRPGAGPQSAQVAAAAWRALRAAQPRRLMVALRGAAAGGDPQLAGAAVQVARAVAAPRNTAPASMAAVPGPASAGPAAAAR